MVQYDAMYVYSKQIKERDIKKAKITRNIDKKNISNVITSLREIGTQKDMDDLELDDNCVIWIMEILSGFTESMETALKYLLRDFTDSMKTRMREGDKYAISIVSDNYLILCHSRGGETTITPRLEVVKRMLDKDNVDRFVFFIKEGESIRVYYYEYNRSESFVNWLGIPEKEAFYYLRGVNRVYVDIDGMHCAIELSDDDVEELFLKDKSTFKIERNQLVLPVPIERLQIGQIRVGRKRYNSMGDFLQDYLAKRYELLYYQEEYWKLANSLEPLTNLFIDDIDSVVKIESGIEQTHLKKRNPNFYILFASRINSKTTIQFRESFFGTIYTDFLNKHSIHIFHAGMKPYSQSSEPLQIGSMKLFNKLKTDGLIERLLDFYHGVQLRDKLIDRMLCYSFFYLLNIKNNGKPISFFFEKFADELGRDIRNSNKIVQNEGDVIEFKSRDYLTGKNNEISKRIAGDLEKKLTTNAFKVYFFGVDETTQEIEPLPNNRFSSDRIGNIENKIAQEMGEGVEVAIVKAPLDNQCLLLMFATSNDGYGGY